MRNLFVFVEGKEDLLFVKKVLHNLFIKHSINIIPIPYQKTRNHEIKKLIKTAKDNQDYVLLSDLDSHTYPCITSRKDKRIKELDDEITSDKIIIVVEELESWCLAGIDTRIDEYSDFVIPESTDDITKEDFDEILSNTSFNKNKLFNYLSFNFNVDLAIVRNESFKYFLKKYGIISMSSS